jgi:protein arginine kinase activator
MLCSICKAKEAKVFLTNMAGDKVQKLDLCETCAKERGVDDSPLPVADTFLGLGTSAAIEQIGGGELRCPGCGFTHADFKKAGRLGCARCYVTFYEGIEGVLKTMHKGPRHQGKVPRVIRQSKEAAERLKTLERRLARAIQEENFEQAALLRDEIRQTTSRGSGQPAT